ncbi:LysR family transcriptional regulator [Flavobacterium algicola]|uniref:LysR family transcriptional regulator n=1 Tax=Flavobacterium algicola TaxID=556529 RepID=UPI001EFED51C|nr:LysR family transcriptional regulator [Flavobacterium algicola]MCG9792044.1 LysR family transcriptional regulator [Flavobacterium algicola]
MFEQIYGYYAIGKNNLNYVCDKYIYIMVNLEWYRTFKSVYKNRNFSLAAKELFISQPAVSQQIGMLEAHVGHKLFNRKSKGVDPTEYANLLNNLIIEALDRLENVENGFRAKAFSANHLITVGISQHLFSSLGSVLISKFDFIDFNFQDDEVLFELVNSKKIDFAIVTQKIDTYDTIQQRLGDIKPVIIGSNSIDTTELQEFLKENDWNATETWLNEKRWYTIDARISHIKLFWMYVFDKKRPTLFANYIIPSEYEMIETLANNHGVGITWSCNAKLFIEQKKVKLLWDSDKMPKTTVYVMCRKNNNFDEILDEITKLLQETLA